MQLLEQLAIGGTIRSDVTDVIFECSSALGYLECMNDYMVSDVMESVVMEGIDVKAILNKIWGFIKGIFEKIGKMIQKLIGFIKGEKKSKSTQNESVGDRIKEAFSGDGRSGGGNDSKGDESDTSSSRPSRTQLLEEMLEKNPYTGPDISAITSTIEDLTSVSSVLKKQIGTAGEVLSCATKLIHMSEKGGWRGPGGAYFNKAQPLKDGLTGILSVYQDRGEQGVIEEITDNISIDGVDRIKSSNEFQHIGQYIYNTNRKKYPDLHNHVFDFNGFMGFGNRADDMIRNYNNRIDTITASLTETKSRVDEYVRKCEDIQKQTNKIMIMNDKLVTSGFDAVNKTLTVIANCVSYTSLGLSRFFVNLTKEKDKAFDYVANLCKLAGGI